MSPAAAIALAPAATKAAEKTAEVIPFLVKTLVVCTIGYIVYNRFTHRFAKWDEVSGYPNASVTYEQAEAKADAVYDALSWSAFGDFDTVKDTLQGLNYNGFVRVYNAFGKRAGNFITGEHDMMEFLNDKLDSDELLELRFMFNGTFF